MTPKEKALELVGKYRNIIMSFLSDRMKKENAKECAIIAVDEILESQPRYPSEVDWDDCGATQVYYYQAQREEAKQYWQQVKNEINML
jgi:hypothetical protein